MLQFDWQNEPEGFKKYMLVHLMTDDNRDLINDLSEPTDHFTNVRLTMQVNGIEVNAEQFFQATENWMSYHTIESAKDLVRGMPRMEDLENVMSLAQEGARRVIEEVFADAGIDLDLSDNYY